MGGVAQHQKNIMKNQLSQVCQATVSSRSNAKGSNAVSSLTKIVEQLQGVVGAY